MREVLGKVIWLIGIMLKGVALLGLYALKTTLGILHLALLIFCMVLKVFLAFVKVGIPS